MKYFKKLKTSLALFFKLFKIEARANLYIHHTSEVLSEFIGDETTIWQFCIILKGAKIGSNVNICSHCFIENNVMIGNNVTIKNGVYIYDGITLEENVFVGPNVTFTNDKRPRSKSINFTVAQTVIKKGASIGAGAVILPGLIIGENAIIGAGAIVTKNIPPNAVVMGNSALITSFIN